MHAGDIGGPSIIADLESIAPVTAVWGNTDGFEIRSRVPEIGKVEVGGRGILVVHGHQLGSPTPQLLASAYPQGTIVVFGHTHRPTEERIGERSRWAYAFRTLHDAGVLLSFGSDWPGTNAAWYPAEPLLGIYAAVTRKTLDGEPAGGWFPEERIDVETALRAYTVNNAWAADEDDIKGRLAPGMLADFVVLDREERKGEKPSDHAPVIIDLDDAPRG